MAKGGGGVGWSKIVLRRQVEVMDDLEGVGPAVEHAPGLAWGPEGANQSSPNHEGNAWTAEAVRAAIHGSTEQRRRAYDTLERGYFGRELSALWAGETMAPDNHGHQILAATGTARIAALLSGDVELLRLSAELFHRTVAALKAVATPDLQVWSAGMRPRLDRKTGKYLAPLASSATAWLRMVVNGDPGLNALRGAGAKAENAWRDPSLAHLRALRYLQRRGDKLARVNPPLAPCPLRYGLTVYRGDNAHLSVLHGPTEAACTWCLVPYLGGKRGERRTLEAVEFDVGGAKQAPPIPRGSYVVRFPGSAS